MKITFAMIVFNGDYVLESLLESIYPYAYKIIIVDGVVKYWADKGYSGSVDDTVKIIKQFPDLDNKIILHEKTICNEKTELCQVYMNDIPEDTDYLWTIDSDEIFKSNHIKKTIQLLEEKKPHSLSFKSRTFFGGFDYYLTGFERNVGFKRVLKYEKGCKYIEHRPPTLSTEMVSNPIHLNCEESYNYGIEMYHYSYVFPKQVFDKIGYYKEKISGNNAIDNYFHEVWLPWVQGNENIRKEIESKYKGVHEFKPEFRGDCYTELFEEEHPLFIYNKMSKLRERFSKELNYYANR